MEEDKIIIQALNPDNFEYQEYISSDQELIASSDLDTVFNEETDYIEFYVYDENNILIYPLNETLRFLSFILLPTLVYFISYLLINKETYNLNLNSPNYFLQKKHNNFY